VAAQPKSLSENDLRNLRKDQQQAEKHKREQQSAELPSLWSRRDFLGRLGWGGFGVFSFIAFLCFIRSAFPRVLFLPPSKFKAGFPGDYIVGQVSEKYLRAYRTG
jgi:hypothetical protein